MVRISINLYSTLGFYAVGVHKGVTDYDDINKLMLPTNKEILVALKNAMENGTTKDRLLLLENNDPTNLYNYPRSGAIDRYNHDNYGY